MDSFIRVEADAYGVVLDTELVYLFLDWSGIALAFAVILALKLRKTIKTKRSKK